MREWPVMFKPQVDDEKANQINDGAHCFQLQYQTTPNISIAEDLQEYHSRTKF